MNLRSPFIIALGTFSAAAAFSNDATLPIMPLLEAEFAISGREAQYILTAGLAGFALGQVPVGMAADRYGRRPVGLACIGLLIAACLLALLAPSFSILLGARFLIGVAASGGPVVSRAVARDVTGTPSETGRLMAAFMVFIAASTIIAPIAASLLMEWINWPAAFLNCLVYGLLAGFLFWRLVPEPESARKPPQLIRQQFFESLGLFMRSPPTLLGTAVISLYFAGYAAFLSTTPLILVDVYGLPPSWFAWLFAISASANVAGAVVCRRFIQSMGAGRLLVTGVAMAVLVGAAFAGFLVLDSLPPLALFWSLVTLFSAGLGIILPTASAIAMAPLPATAGFTSSFLGTVQIAFATLISLTVAGLYQRDTDGLFLVVAGLAAALIVVVVAARQRLLHAA